MPRQVITKYSCDAIEIWLEECGSPVGVMITDRKRAVRYRTCMHHAQKYLGALGEGAVSFETCTGEDVENEPVGTLPQEHNDRGIWCDPCQKYFKAFSAHNRKVHKIYARKREKDDDDQIAFAVATAPASADPTEG